MASVTTLTRRRSALDPRGPGERGSAAGLVDQSGGRLRRRLVAAGPLAARFGIHLGSRVDLLRGSDCLRLLEIADRAPASPSGPIEELVDRELGARPEELFEVFDPEPFDSGLVFQWHSARLLGGERATLQVIHPELEEELESGSLRLLTRQLIDDGDLPEMAAAAVDEFQAGLDLRQVSAALDRLADAMDGSRWVEVAATRGRLCSPRARVISSVQGRSAASMAVDGEPAVLGARARRLGRLWHAMVLRGDLFPAEPWGRNVRYLERSRVIFLEGAVARLPRYLLGDLKEYLAAVAAGEPARAALAFSDLLPGRPTDRQLLFRLRHADPFRDRGLDVGGDRFVRQVLAHWQTALESGHRPMRELSPFYRGLFLLNHEVRSMAVDGASIRDGFREARLLLLLEELREGVGERGAEVLERQLSLLSDLPQKLDRILTLAARRDESESDDGRRFAEREPPPRSSVAVGAACLLALTAVALLAGHLAGAGALGVWVERVGAVLVLLLGGLLLRAVTSSEGG